MITYKLTLSIGFANGNREDEITVKEMGYTDEEWNNLTEDQKEDELINNWKEWSSDYIDGGWEIIE